MVNMIRITKTCETLKIKHQPSLKIINILPLNMFLSNVQMYKKKMLPNSELRLKNQEL